MCCVCLLAMTAGALALFSYIYIRLGVGGYGAVGSGTIETNQARHASMNGTQPVSPGFMSPTPYSAPIGAGSMSKENDEWIKKVLNAFGGAGRGGATTITNEGLDKMLNNPLVYNVCDHLQVCERVCK